MLALTPLRKLPRLDMVPDVQAGRSGTVPWPGWVQKWELNLKDVVIALYLLCDLVYVLVFTSPNARSWCV